MITTILAERPSLYTKFVIDYYTSIGVSPENVTIQELESTSISSTKFALIKVTDILFYGGKTPINRGLFGYESNGTREELRTREILYANEAEFINRLNKEVTFSVYMEKAFNVAALFFMRVTNRSLVEKDQMITPALNNKTNSLYGVRLTTDLLFSGLLSAGEFTELATINENDRKWFVAAYSSAKKILAVQFDPLNSPQGGKDLFKMYLDLYLKRKVTK